MHEGLNKNNLKTQILDIIKKNIDKESKLINDIINKKERIPLVNYRIEGNDIFITSQYSNIKNLYIHVQKQNEILKIKLNENINNTQNQIIYSNNIFNDLHNCYLNENKSIFIIINGTSGSGKSTLSCLLSYFLKIKIILSTDIIREILRKYNISNKELHVSTYESWKISSDDENKNEKLENDEKLYDISKENIKKNEHINEYKIKKCIKNYLKQCNIVFNYMENIIDEYIKKNESIIIEGVHMNYNIINKLQNKYSKKIISFLIYNEDKETNIKRFLKRCPIISNNKTNKYIDNIDYIYYIQQHLLYESKKHPIINFIHNDNIIESLNKMFYIIYISIYQNENI